MCIRDSVGYLEEILSQIKDKTLPVRVSIPKESGVGYHKDDDSPNYWIDSVFVRNTGDSGYEQNGEVELWGHE